MNKAEPEHQIQTQLNLLCWCVLIKTIVQVNDANRILRAKDQSTWQLLVVLAMLLFQLLAKLPAKGCIRNKSLLTQTYSIQAIEENPW